MDWPFIISKDLCNGFYHLMDHNKDPLELGIFVLESYPSSLKVFFPLHSPTSPSNLHRYAEGSILTSHAPLIFSLPCIF